MQDRYRKISFVTSTSPKRISFKEHMKRGVHMLSPLPAGIKGRFVRKIMLLLDGISVRGQSTRERERVHSCNVCDNAVKSLQMPSQHRFGSTVASCLPARVMARSSTPTTPSTDTISLCVASLTTERVFVTSPCGARATIEEFILNPQTCGGRRRGRGRFLPAPGRGQTSSALSNGNLLCWCLISLFV